jgi:hypothetical protein
MPIHITDPAYRTIRKIQSLSIIRHTPKDTVCDARAVPLGGYDTRQWNSMACDDEYAQEGRVTDEQVAFFVYGQAIRSGDTETRDFHDQKVWMVGEVGREMDIQNLQTFVVVPSL